MRPPPQFPKVRVEFVKLDGGLDIMSPPVDIPPGFCRNAQNHECGINGGYSRILGYERFDGRPSPSDAAYAILNATITGSWAVGNTLTGQTSGATAVIAAATLTYFVLAKITGTYSNGENLQISAVTVAVSGGSQIIDSAATTKLHAQYKNAAADIYRADITTVPGSGKVLGVVQFNDVVYAFRNNAGGSAAVLYKSTTAGWSAVTMFYELSFTAGSGTVPSEGGTITKGTVSAVVKRVVLQSGSWGAGTAAGRFIIAAPTGGSFSSGAFTAGVTATCSGAETAITLNTGGHYEFSVSSFNGVRRVYGCSGANRGFEFDGTVYVPITTGMTDDRPSFVAVHKNHLFFSFSYSVQHSGIGLPYQWTPISGAAELAMTDTVTGLVPQPGAETAGGAMAIFSRNRINVLYGNSSANWNLVTYADEQGAMAYSAQQIAGTTLVLDDIGVTSLAASMAYGNFDSAALSKRVKSWVNSKIAAVRASCVVRGKSQYRLFFSDNTALYVSFDGKKVRGMMPMLFTNDVACIHSAEKTNGSEVIYFGSSDGYVYQMEKGTSFDGASIDSFLWLVFNHSRGARQRKRYKRAALEIEGTSYVEFNFGYELSYATTEIVQESADIGSAINFTPTFWDAVNWDAFVWDGQSLAPSDFPMEGSGENMSVILSSKSDYFMPMTFTGLFIHYIPRRMLR